MIALVQRQAQQGRRALQTIGLLTSLHLAGRRCPIWPWEENASPPDEYPERVIGLHQPRHFKEVNKASRLVRSFVAPLHAENNQGDSCAQWLAGWGV